MLFGSLSIALLTSSYAYASRGQIPVIDGVIAGVPKMTSGSSKDPFKPVLASTGSSTRVPGKLRYVENSGVCETTPGVHQVSGYADLTKYNSMFFWYFQARNNATTAPLVLWLNGGPGASSMVALFQENGPCRINADQNSVSLNPYSWSNTANVLYVDQPIGSGFSHGNLDVDTTAKAGADLWKMLQIFFSHPKFSHLQARDFAFWTESYGGHYGPDFSLYFLKQNDAIRAGKIDGKIINLKVLGIGNGLTDPLNQYPGYISYAASNPYHPSATKEEIKAANDSFYRSGGCQSQIQACYDSHGKNRKVCSEAQDFCNKNLLFALDARNDFYDVREPIDNPYPPNITTYLTKPSVLTKIGVDPEAPAWQLINVDVFKKFGLTGDWMHNSAPNLERVIDAGIRTVLYNGDADYIVNYIGVEAFISKLKTKHSSKYNAKPFGKYTVNGHLAGLYKNAGTFSYIRVFGAGHEVPAYNFTGLATGQVASQMFEQAMGGGPLVST